jgi:hypothetical protein
MQREKIFVFTDLFVILLQHKAIERSSESHVLVQIWMPVDGLHEGKVEVKEKK